MDAIKVVMPKEAKALKEDLRTLTDGKVWFYLDNEAMSLLKERAEEIREVSNLTQIQYENIWILAGPHTSGWWRLYSLDGELFFREAANPEAVVFMKG